METIHGVLRTFAFAALIVLATAAWAGDDTARFYGTWKTTVPLNGQTVTIVSIHDANGYRNFVRTPTGDVPADVGTFSAANGKWSSSAAAPNNGGVYHFVGNDTVVATNAAGQTVTWIRDKSAAASAPALAAKSPAPVDANTAANRGTGYVPPSGRPGTSVVPQPAAAPPATSPTPALAVSPDDPSLSPNVKAGFAALKSGDRVTAWRDFMADAQKGDSDAQAAVGSMLLQNTNPPGTGFYRDCEKWLLASAKQGNQHGMDMLAQYYFMEGRNIAGGINPGVNNARIPPQLQQQADAKFALARQWFEKSAAKGDLYAMGNLAIILDAGLGGPSDPNRAAQLRAQVGKGPDTNFAKRVNTDPASKALAASWQAGHYEDAIKTAQVNAAKGDANAEALLGRAYYEGLGVPRNYATALTWLNKAAAQNNADAMFFLGLMYEHGRGVTQDLDKALKLFDQATALGQGYAKLEATGMRVQGEINRTTSRTRGGIVENGLSDGMCQAKGGISNGSSCYVQFKGNVDPYEYDPNSGGGFEAPEPAYEPEPEQ
jgi:TPR repeat protein